MSEYTKKALGWLPLPECFAVRPEQPKKTVEDAWEAIGPEPRWDWIVGKQLVVECIKDCSEEGDKVGDIDTAGSGYSREFYRLICTREEFEAYGKSLEQEEPWMPKIGEECEYNVTPFGKEVLRNSFEDVNLTGTRSEVIDAVVNHLTSPESPFKLEKK